MKQSLWPLLLAITIYFQGSAQEWEQLSDIPFSARHHAIGFAHEDNGYVLTGSLTKDIWKYTASTDSWESLGDYPGPERGYGIGDEMDGKLYFGFGIDNEWLSLNDLWVFDPVDESFEELPSCPCVGRTHPAMIALNGFVYVGMGGGDKRDWWAYDVSNRTWEQKAFLPGPGRHHPYQFKIGDYIYAGSGHFYDWYRYDPSNDSWIKIADLTDIERVAGTQFSYNGKGYALSGLGNPDGSSRHNHDNFETGEFWEYDPENDSWTELPPHPGQSRWSPISFILDGYVYMSTGETVDGNDNTHFRYHLGEVTTSVSEAVEEMIAFSPNPTRDMIYFTGIEPGTLNSQIELSIYDLSGKKIMNTNNIDLHSGVSTSELSPGNYFIQLTIDDQVYVDRIIIE